MLRAALLLAVLLLAACSRGSRDPLLAEVKSPLRAAVRFHERALEGSCRDVTGLERVQCWLGLRRGGCLYLELGEHPATPVGDCGLPATGDRVLLDEAPDRRVELAVDATGERVAVHSGGRWVVFYLEQGWALWRTTPPALGSPPLDWARVESVEAHLPHLYAAALASPERRERLGARLRALGGEAAMIELLYGDREGDYASWKHQLETLSTSAQQTLLARLTAGLSLDGGVEDGTWVFLADHPELQPPDYAERVLTWASDLDARLQSDQDLDWALDALQRQHHPQAAPLACRVLEHAWLSKVFRLNGEYESSPSIASVSALAVLAETRAPCPVLTRWLESWPCSTPLECEGPLLPDAGRLPDDEPLRAPGQRCTPAQQREALERWRKDQARPRPEEEEADDAGTPGDPVQFEAAPFFVAALEAQPGPRPPQFTQQDRVLYQLLEARPATGCLGLHEQLCLLPVTVTELTVGSCHLRIDDARRTVLFSASGSAAAAPRTPP